MPPRDIKIVETRVERNDAGVLFLAFLACLILQFFRAKQSRWLSGMWIETAIFLAMPLLLTWLMNRKGKEAAQSIQSGSLLYFSQFGAVVIMLLSLVWQFGLRWFKLGDSNEVMALIAMQNVGWFVAVFSAVRGFRNVAIMLCGSLVFFVCCMTESIFIYVMAGLFATSTLWWMSGRYWNRLDRKAIDGESKMLPVRTSAIVASVFIIGLLSFLVSRSSLVKNQFDITGFSPFSGGEDGFSQEFARSGIGDGHMLTSGQDATTTGAIDSDQFIQDHKESIYDVSTEFFNGPVFKRKRTRSMTLEEVAKHMHDVKQSEQSGKTFHTMRENESSQKKDLESKRTAALFFVEGPVPARFPNDSFNYFDGWQWEKKPIEAEEKITLQPRVQLRIEQQEHPYYQLLRTQTNYLTAKRYHRVKMMRLNTTTLPAPPLVDQWRIEYVSSPDLFRWNENGLVEMDGDHIPTHTIVDSSSMVPNLHTLRESRQAQQRFGTDNISTEDRSVYLQVPDTRTRSYLLELVQQWTDDVPPGYRQVEAIVKRLKTDFRLNPNLQGDKNADDTISHFFEKQGGTALMFATTCTMLLRSAGYKTRIVRGFVVQKDDYDRVAEQSVVDADNLHWWPEVCLDGKHWIPVEATPGMPEPCNTETLRQWLSSTIAFLRDWIRSHPLKTALAVTLVTLTVLFRIRIVAAILMMWWNFIRLVRPSHLLTTTRKVVDWRFRLAGNRRPPSRTIRSWYSQVAPEISIGFFELWNQKNYSDRPWRIKNADLIDHCRTPINLLTISRIKKFVSQNDESSADQ